MSEKTVIIGIDGVPFHLIRDLTKSGDMPNFASLINEGYISKMRSAIPEVSNVNWSSMVTGKNPGEHGIYGFTELIQGTYTVSFPDRRALQAEEFWKDGRRHIVLNVPATYPAEEINGVMISGFVSPELERAVTPESALDYLKSIDYSVDVDSEKAHKSKRLFLDNLFETLEKRKKAYEHFWEEKWDVFMLVFTGSDRLEHFLWHAYEDESHEYHERFIDYFREVDKIIGDIMDKMGEDDRLIALSDHGMEQIKENVNVNAHLEKHGFLKLGDKPEERYKNIAAGTKAFALDPGRIYINEKGRYPRGKVEDSDQLIEDIIASFDDLRYEGQDVIKKIWKKEDIYSGEYMDRAPDIVLTPHKGFNLKGGVKYDDIFEQNIFSGKHTEHNAFLYCNNKELPDNPVIEYVRSLINKS
ncbi:MAG: alkaline phosphatase family protein [Thermoplasmatota archaeon]